MAADEVKFAEAIAALTARLETWGVDEPHDKARDYVTDMIRHGWRPRALALVTPSYRPEHTPAPPDLMASMRADIAAAKVATTPKGRCSQCGEVKFLAHGPLCPDCYAMTYAPPPTDSEESADV